MKVATLTALFATLLAASSCVEARDMQSSTGMVRRHHSKQAQQLQKRAFSGKATWYGVNPGDLGACGGELNAGDFFVALNQGQYGSLNAQSPLCGKTITITNGVKTAQAKILDACPMGEQCHFGALDMSRALFSYFNDFSVGVFDITWWIGGDGDGPSSASKSSSSSSSNNDKSDSSSASSNNDTANAKAAANRLAEKKKEAAKEAEAEKKKKEEAAKKAAAKKKKEEAAKKKKLAAKKKKEAAKKAAAEKVRTAQKQNIAAFGEIMQTLNQMVESAGTSS